MTYLHDAGVAAEDAEGVESSALLCLLHVPVADRAVVARTQQTAGTLHAPADAVPAREGVRIFCFVFFFFCFLFSFFVLLFIG